MKWHILSCVLLLAKVFFTLNTEAQLDDGALADPIHTTVCWGQAVRPMRFAIDAATQVSTRAHHQEEINHHLNGDKVGSYFHEKNIKGV